MKKTLILTTIAAALIASANSYQVTTVDVTSGNAVLEVTTSANAGIVFSYSLTDAGTNDVTLLFFGSVDGQTFNTTPDFTLTLTANGTNTVTTSTDLNVGALGWWQCTVSNANTAPITNAVLKLATK